MLKQFDGKKINVMDLKKAKKISPTGALKGYPWEKIRRKIASEILAR